MELIKAAECDFEKITGFYKSVVGGTENMSLYGRWIYGLHPNDAMISDYIRQGAMYYCEINGEIVSAVAVLPYQNEDYHGAKWESDLPDGDVATVHILCVNPRFQRRGIARETMLAVIEQAEIMQKKTIRLDALKCNLPAHRLYASLGFAVRDTKQWYAENTGPADFVLFEKNI